MQTIGTISRGIKAPIFKQGDHLAPMVADCVINASVEGKFEIHDRDIIGITEAVVARTQGNYATLEQIAKDVSNKFGKDATVGLILPILSRNRFCSILKAISMGVKKLYIMLSYPKDEVGNPLISQDQLDDANVNPYSDCFNEEEFRKLFPVIKHPFTGVDYIKLYKETAVCDTEIILANKPEAILKYTKNVINADIHTRKRTKRILLEKGAEKVYSLDDFLTESVDGSGYNKDCGLLGTNLATDTSVKLFPRDGQKFVDELHNIMLERTGKNVEVMIYGDGAFKDPVGGIWELADPVVSPAFTSGLIGTPNEIKLKYLADNKLGNLTGAAAKEEMKKMIKAKKSNLGSDATSLGTTPRRLTDLLGSLCDLTSGSGDKGTPIIFIQGYFDNYATD